ncbi:aspartate aminotransferase B [Gluconacetobacter liquefaciens]|uniref:Aminotransferase n=1 Tax=Gluconacetobacter liquefaciens TaxID=89584 RepID=A0A370GAX6_GLULI|nr:pyridoxal phosphate-dependent aminotransferase [Gluconacetobacter liquefaciens]MBB2185411.1 pyridoxal phosphate-dependent aminotransferase [Gluconacetobacter liquefaciens]RDI40857.1 aspartate aminotransferase [Gluconacetobacter liquefaciens]GBQ92140.1 aspartate aminotransferase [Gluconacetobacter liquefaciens NRIC 0522]GEB39314.1 aspartate aminotransferase B [Gluconacetobacter liquefaciens]
MGCWPEFSRSAKLNGIGISEIIRIGTEARKLATSHDDVISLSAGEPDFSTPDNVKLAGINAILTNQTRYTALDGTAALKAAIRRKFQRENGLDYAENEISVGAGAKQVLFNILMATLDPGDEVIVPTPCWTTYLDMIRLAGGTATVVPCSEETGFRLSPEQLAATLTPRTRWLLLNSPSNPTGAVYRASHLAALGEVLRAVPRVGIISDDIYEHVLYDPAPFATMAATCPDLKPRVVTVNGVSKAYSMTGWRVGYAAAAPEVITAMAIVQSQSSSNPCSISQAAAIEALDGPQDAITSRRNAFRSRRDRIVTGLNTLPHVHCTMPDGAFYAFADMRALLARPELKRKGIIDDAALCRYFLHECHVAIVPGFCFGGPGYLRLSYAASDKMIDDALERMKTGVNRLLAV